MRPRIIFITGTDTGVGKTVLTAVLLSHLRQTGSCALALKPFCSGGRADAELLHALQNGDLTLDEINPFHFKEPLAPLAAARLHRRKIPLQTVLTHIHAASEKLKTKHSKLKTPVLLIEGAGGLLSPLGELASSRITHHASQSKVPNCIYSALDLIKALDCEVMLVAANRLGAINHTLLTLDKLRQTGIQNPLVVLNDLLSSRHSSLVTRHNPGLLSEIAKPMQIIPFPYLAKFPTARDIRSGAQKARNPLRKISKLLTL